MTAGFELLIGPAAEGLASLITDTTKTGSSSALGKGIQALSSKSKQAIFQASRKYIENYHKRHCQLKVLGMREPVDLSAVYTGVKLLDKRETLRFEPEALENAFRKTRLRGYSASHREDEKHPGIAIANEKQYLMVLGGPGAGKSTFLRKVGLEALRTFYYERAEYGHRLIPVLLELKRFEANNIDIAKFITAEFETCGFPEAEAFTQNALTQGNLLVLLDGLDEVPSTNLNKVLQTIRDFVDRYDDNRFISSCRVAASGYHDDAFRRFSDVTMADFDDEQIQQFIRNWFGCAQDMERNTAEKCWEALKTPENKASKELAHTPLLLTYLCLVYDLSQRFPNNRSSLYKKALRILLEEWAAEKRILRDDIYEGLSIEQEEILLSEIAYEGMVADQLFFTRRELSAQIKGFLSNNLNAPKHLDSEAVLNAIEVQQGILVERAEDLYSFSHLTLQEYLTAQYLVNNNEWKALVKNHLIDNRWREIFLLIPGLMTGKQTTDAFILAMEKQSRKYVQSRTLHLLIHWAMVLTENLSLGLNPVVGRLSAIDFACSRANQYFSDLEGAAYGIDLDRVKTQVSDFDLYMDLEIALEFESLLPLDLTQNLINSLMHGQEFESDLSSNGLFNNVDFNKFFIGVERINFQRPNCEAAICEVRDFLIEIYSYFFSVIGIKPHIAMLSQEDNCSLCDYLYICELMIRCKEGAVRVSPEVWAGIESRILTVPAVSEATAD